MNAPTIANDGPWTLGVKIGLPFVAVCAALLIALCVYMVHKALHADDERCGSKWSPRKCFRVWSWVPFLLLALFVGGMLWAYFPYDGAYHQYREVHGKVRAISSRIVSAGDQGGSDQKFVVVFDGSPQQFAINDSRAALVHPGDVITIACIRTFQYGSTDGYDCNWGTP